MLTADTRKFFFRAREENLVRAGSVLSMEGSSQAGCPPRNTTREANKAHEADTPYMPYKSYKTYGNSAHGKSPWQTMDDQVSKQTTASKQTIHNI